MQSLEQRQLKLRDTAVIKLWTTPRNPRLDRECQGASANSANVLFAMLQVFLALMFMYGTQKATELLTAQLHNIFFNIRVFEKIDILFVKLMCE
jgi:hypothetical protein